MNRRKMIIGSAIGSVALAGVYPFLEAKWVRVSRLDVKLPNLP